MAKVSFVKSTSVGKAKLNKDLNCYEHSGCGGSIMFDGYRTESSPVDLLIAGIPGGAAVVIWKKIRNYVSGGCLKCRKDGLFLLSEKISRSTKKKIFK